MIRASTGVEHLIDEREDSNAAELPKHMVKLRGDEWGAWRWVGMRGAGFPANHVLKFAAPEYAALADKLIEAEDEARRAKEAALELIRSDLKEVEADSRALLNKAKKQLVKGNLPEPLGAECSAQAAIDAYRSAHVRLGAVQDEFRRTHDATELQLSQAVYDVAGSSLFREAVIWQNRRAYHTAIDSLLRKPVDDTSSKQRRNQEMVASYLQRYCVKNDTIGFFGPVGWMKLNPLEQSLTVRPGPGLLAARTVFFEAWCVDAFCEALSKNLSLLPWVAPRRMPYIYLDGASLYMEQSGFGVPIKLPPAQVALLQACDGARIARHIARDLMASHPAQFKSEMDVYRLLGIIRNMGLIAWAVEVPFRWRPELELREQLERIGDERLKRPALAGLTELERAREEVAKASGNVDALDKALGQLDETFTRLTGTASTRGAGETYAGRTIVFEDCRRDIEAEMGGEMLEELGRPLSLLLTGARWFCSEVARRYRELLKGIYKDLAQKSGSKLVDGSALWAKAEPLMSLEDTPLVNELVASFQQHWAGILAISPEQRRVQFSSEELRERVEEVFAAPRPGWEFAHYHSPDVMIAASGADAIRRGEYYFVMGEFHMGKNTLNSQTFLNQHPAPHEMVQGLAEDLRLPCVIPTLPKNASVRIRGLQNYQLPTDYFLEFGLSGAAAPRSRVLPTGNLLIELQGDDLIVRTRDGKLKFDIIEFFGYLLSNIAVNCFRTLRTSNHMPRVTIDRLVIYREWWCFSAAELAWANEKDDAARFIAARRWARENNVPRFVFIKSPVEKKPFYVDFDSPIYISMFGKTIRRTLEKSPEDARITVTEMLPEHNQTWLPDAEGQRYTSELRIVAFDLSDRNSRKPREGESGFAGDGSPVSPAPAK